MIPYNLNIPNAPNNPSADQPNMQENTNSINQLLGIDHVSFNDVTNPNGYHTVIHQTKQAVDPAAIPGYNQVYAKDYTPDTTGPTTDTQLFTRSGGGPISQLTGHLAGDDGYQWIGGTLVQWGRVVQSFATNMTVTGTVVFRNRVPGAIKFPTNCFMVNATFTRGVTTVSQAANTLVIINNPPISATQFEWQVRVGSSSFTGFFWWAIGN